METTTPPEQQVKPKTGDEQMKTQNAEAIAAAAKAKLSDAGVTPDTPANRAAAQAGAEALKRKVEGLANSKPPQEEPKPKKEVAPTRRTLKQAVDAMDEEIARLENDAAEKRCVFEKLRMDIATTDATIRSIKRIRGEFA